MLYTEQSVRDNLRTREGKRVFFQKKGDTLTPGARDWLGEEKIPIRPAEEAAIERYVLENGSELREKPEDMTHLQGNLLVSKTHPRIRFRGELDLLEAELLLMIRRAEPELGRKLRELLKLSRQLLAAEVLEKPLEAGTLWGMGEEEIHRRSHFPQEAYGIPHFMPEPGDTEKLLELNRLRARVRQAELAAAAAFQNPAGRCGRVDILKCLNRMSSGVYLLMLEEKKRGTEP